MTSIFGVQVTVAIIGLLNAFAWFVIYGSKSRHQQAISQRFDAEHRSKSADITDRLVREQQITIQQMREFLDEMQHRMDAGERRHESERLELEKRLAEKDAQINALRSEIEELRRAVMSGGIGRAK